MRASGRAPLWLTACTAIALVAAAVVPVVVGGDRAGSATGLPTVGLVDTSQGRWHLRDANGAVDSFYFGNPGDVPIVGDWDCNGTDTPGMYRPTDGFVYLSNVNDDAAADVRFFFGNPGDVPLAGDFDGDGCDTVSLYRPDEGRFFIINELGADETGLGAADLDYLFGDPGDTPFAGDFTGDGIETVGLHRASTGRVYLRHLHTRGVADEEFVFGDPGDRLVAGDWNGDGLDSPAAFRPSDTTFYLRFGNGAGIADDEFTWGDPDWIPVSGSFGLGGLPPTTTFPVSSTLPPAPPDPGDSKDCTDFLTRTEAIVWYAFYFRHYGDVAGLDADGDGRPCESLPADDGTLMFHVDEGPSSRFNAPVSWRVKAFRLYPAEPHGRCGFMVYRRADNAAAGVGSVRDGGWIELRGPDRAAYHLSGVFGDCLLIALDNGPGHLATLPLTTVDSDSLPFDAAGPWTLAATRESGSGDCRVQVRRDADGTVAGEVTLASGAGTTVTATGRLFLSPLGTGCRFAAS